MRMSHRPTLQTIPPAARGPHTCMMHAAYCISSLDTISDMSTLPQKLLRWLFNHGPLMAPFQVPPPLGMTAQEVAALGPGLASKMSKEQLAEAVRLYNAISGAPTPQNSVPLATVSLVFNNHLRGCIRMPAGGATAGGSQQTGFEMELITSRSRRPATCSTGGRTRSPPWTTAR